MSSLISKITGALSSDLVFLATLFVLIYICVIYFSRTRIISLIISFYPASLLYKLFPYTDKLLLMEGNIGIFLNKLIIFLVFYIITNIALSRFFHSYTDYSTTPRKLGLSLAILVLILLFSYTIANFDVLHNFSDKIDALFAVGDRVFWWAIVPLVIMLFV